MGPTLQNTVKQADTDYGTASSAPTRTRVILQQYTGTLSELVFLILKMIRSTLEYHESIIFSHLAVENVEANRYTCGVQNISSKEWM